MDGDTIVINQESIRIWGIDAPEMEHPFGWPAKRAVMNMCQGQIVTAMIVSDDHHGRIVAKCYLEDGRDIAAELVKIGLALDWAKYSGGVYRPFEPDSVREKLWRCERRQKGEWIDAKTAPSYSASSKTNIN